ncbi:MAG: TlpA family protein disulfide reductase, partial [Flavobacteriales bacterium]
MRLLWLFLIVPFFANGQHTIIKGVAPLSIGKEIQLRVKDDPITQKERVLASQIVDVDGSFELKAVVNGTQYAFLQVGLDCADFFIERDKDLELSFVPPKQDPKKPRGFYERNFFIPKTTGGTLESLNGEIVAFNDSIDQFLEALYPLLVQRRSPKIVAMELAGFEEKMLKHFAKAEPFVQDYIAYSLAGVEQTFLTDRKRLFEKYLKGKKVQPTNPAFIDFVVQFYQGTVYNTLMVNRIDEVQKILKGQEVFAGLDEILAEDQQLQNTFLRRLMLINSVKELIGHKSVDSKKLLVELKRFGGLMSNSYLAQAAKNMAKKHEKLAVGSMAPEISFYGIDGETRQLSDLQESYVFLELTDVSNTYCQRETNVIPNLKNEFRNIRFLTVCVGNSQKEMESIQKKVGIDWDFGRVPIASSVIEDYDVKSLPLF